MVANNRISAVLVSTELEACQDFYENKITQLARREAAGELDDLRFDPLIISARSGV